MEVICTPDPDPFVDKWHPAIGHVKKDEKHRIECEVCHRYLKTFAAQVDGSTNSFFYQSLTPVSVPLRCSSLAETVSYLYI